MESAKQRIRAVAARQKAEKKAQKAGGEASSTPKASTKQAKRKPDGSNHRSAKKAVITPGATKEKSPPKPSHGAGKGAMTSLSPVNEGPSSNSQGLCRRGGQVLYKAGGHRAL